MSSKTPVNGVGYDKSLLADAPEVTKADKQEGYNPDLLEQGNSSSRPSPRPGTVPPGGKYTASDSSHGRGKHIATAATLPPATKQRSKKLWFIVAAFIFIIVVVVATVVGVKESHKNSGGGIKGDSSNSGSLAPTDGSQPTSASIVAPAGAGGTNGGGAANGTKPLTTST